MNVTNITIPPQGPSGEAQTLELSDLREQAEGFVLEGAETRPEQALAIIVVCLIDQIYEMNKAWSELS